MNRICRSLLNRTVGFLVFLLCSAIDPSAVETALRIDRFVFSGGGGTSTNIRFGVTGTIGQKEGAEQLTGGRFAVMPGFWSTIGLVQLPDSPLLELQRVGSDLVLRWPATAADQGFVLEQSGSVGTGASWSVVDNTASNVGVFRQLEIPVQPGTRFYRLQRP